jgi:L-alanine-DL-glutamate epimerase-like enolase superfamily enzyme
MKIDRATIQWVAPPYFPEPVYDSTLGPFQSFPAGILTLEAEGLSGFGIVPLARAAADFAEETFLPLLWSTDIGDIASIEHFWMVACRRLRNIGPGISFSTLSGIETALWDLLAKKSNCTLAKILGATSDRVPVYGSNGWTNFDTNRLVSSVESLVSRGFSLVKIKVGIDGGTAIHKDVLRVRAVRRAVGDNIRIAVDANQCWTPTDALSFAQKIADQHIEWFEEPIPAQNLLGYSALTKTSPIPLAAGECLAYPELFRTLLHLQGIAIAQPVLTVIGGITPYRRVAAIAREYSTPLACGGYSQLMCSLVAGAPTGSYTEFLTPFMDSFSQLWQEKPDLQNGEFLLSQRPGHGLVPDAEFCGKYQEGNLLAFTPGSAAFAIK